MPQDATSEAQLRFYHKIWRTISFQSTVTSSPSSPITTSSAAEGQSPVANYIGQQQQQMQQVESVHEEVPMDDHDTEDQEAQRYHENGYSEVDEKKMDATTGVLQQNGVKSTTTTTAEATQVKNCLITSPSSPPLGVTHFFLHSSLYSWDSFILIVKTLLCPLYRQLHQS